MRVLNRFYTYFTTSAQGPARKGTWRISRQKRRGAQSARPPPALRSGKLKKENNERAWEPGSPADAPGSEDAGLQHNVSAAAAKEINKAPSGSPTENQSWREG